MAGKTGAKKAAKKTAKKAAKTGEGVGRKAERTPANQFVTAQKMLNGIADKLTRIQGRAEIKGDKDTGKRVDKALKAVQSALQA